jgi:peptidyl-dipeptidase Dcp
MSTTAFHIPAHRIQLLAIFCAPLLVMSARAADESPSPLPTAAMIENPLLKESSLDFHYPPFDKIKDEHFSPAYELGMAEQLKEIEPIASRAEPPTFENTIVALEKTGNLLGRVDRIFSNLASANTNPQLQKTESDMAPKLSAHQDAIFLNGPLFKRVQTLYDTREKLGLDEESKWLIDRYYKDFVRAGARLSEADTQKLNNFNA